MIDAVQAGLEQDRGRRKTVNVTVQLKSAFDSLTDREQEIMYTGTSLTRASARESIPRMLAIYERVNNRALKDSIASSGVVVSAVQ